MKNNLKKNLLPALILMLTCLLTGCGGQGPEEFVTEKLEQVKAGDDEAVEILLSQGLESIEGDYVLEFPEELKVPYYAFLKEACSSMQYEIVECKKHNSGYKVNIELTPVDVADTVEAQDEAYVQNLDSFNLAEEVEELLEEDTELLAHAESDKSQLVTLYLKKGDDGYEFADGDWESCVGKMLSGYMAPYKHVAEVLDERDYLIAALDATYKGEAERYAKHMGMTEEAVLAEYEASFTEIDLSGMEMTSEQETRFLNAMKSMFKSCQYEVGVARKGEDDGYLIDVTVTPNLSLRDSGAQFDRNVNNGRYGTVEQVKEGYLQILEDYAANPVYGETTTVEFHMSLGNLLYSGSGENEFDKLGEIIIPSVE